MTTSLAQPTLSRPNLVGAALLNEFITLTRDGAPVCWPLVNSFEAGRIVVSTGYAYPTKARNARRNPKVAVFYNDPPGMEGAGAPPYVLVQGDAVVLDQDLQHNTERYIDQILRASFTPGYFKVVLRRFPWLMQSWVGYTTRIFVEVTPQREYVWERTAAPPLCACRPNTFEPGSSIRIPDSVFTWLPRYTRPPTLAFVTDQGYPAATAARASVEPERIIIDGGPSSIAGAPACLTYHRHAPNMMANDAFMIRGYLDGDGNLVPQRVVGWTGTADDRGVGSLKAMRLIGQWRKELTAKLAAEGRPVPIVRSSSSAHRAE